MKHIHVITWVILMLFCREAKSAATWTNEPATATPLLDCPFNSLSECHFSGGGPAIVSDPTAPVSPSGVAKSTLRAGANMGGSEIYYYYPLQREIFVGIVWRTNPEFEGRQVGNKMFFIRGPGMNGLIGMPAPGSYWGGGTVQWGFNTSGLDNSHITGSTDPGVPLTPNVGSGTVYFGTWYKIEVYIKSSTNNTSRDGIIRWWINGNLVGNYTQVNYAGGGLDTWAWSETWDGTVNPVPTVEWAHYFDHLHISVPNCGSSGCAAPSYLVITSSLPPARTGTPYTATLSAGGGTKPYTWFLDKGKLPAGLSLSSNGVISGTPTCAGRNDFTIRATDASAPAITTTKSYSVIVSGTGTCPIAITNGTGARTEAKPFMAKAVSGKVTFNLPVTSSAPYRLTIYDLTGKQVYEHRSMGQKETSIAKILKTGVYVAKFEQGRLISALRFSVMK